MTMTLSKQVKDAIAEKARSTEALMFNEERFAAALASEDAALIEQATKQLQKALADVLFAPSPLYLMATEGMRHASED